MNKIKEKCVVYNILLISILINCLFIISSCVDNISIDENIILNINNQKEIDSLNNTRSIGTEGFFEKYVDIEDFKDFQFESNTIHKNFKNTLENLTFYDEFPSVESNIYTRDSLTKILKENCKYVQDIPEGFESGLYYDYMNEKSFVTNYDQNKKVDAFVEVIFERDYQNESLKVLSPKEAYNLLNHQDRTNMRFRGCNKNGKFYFTMYIDSEKYSELTGLDELEIISLRIITFTRLQIFPNPPGFEKYLDEADLCHYIYQFPYKDNYKDYQNESLKVTDDRLLKKYIKPGSIIFVYDKKIESLNDHTNLNFNNGHSIIVTNYWYDLPDNMNSKDIKSDYSQYGYQSIDQYKSINENSSFLEVDELRKDAFDDNISLRDYLKRFVFIEAVKKSLNDNSLIPLHSANKCVKYTTGNDKFALERFDNYTVVAISNLNKGYKLSNTLVQSSMIEYSKKRIQRFYDNLPTENESFFSSYCSGLVYFGYKNNKNIGISILKPEHGSKYKNLTWYMPRTLTNSPFIYTRILYK